MPQDKHKPALKVILPEIQARLDAGNDFGDRAMGMFGPYEEMTVYRPGTTIPDKKAMLQKTQEHLKPGHRSSARLLFPITTITARSIFCEKPRSAMTSMR